MSESTTAGPRPATPGAATQDPTIRPFHVSVPDEDLVELRRRIEATRWPERETVDDDSQGVPLATMQELVKGFATGDPPPSDLSDEERTAYEQLRSFYAKHVAYANIMATRPQTMYGLADSPVDLAAFMLDHGDGTGQPGLVKQVLEGTLQSDLTRDDLLDNIHYNRLDRGGHFAAWEQPQLFSEEIRAAFRSLR